MNITGGEVFAHSDCGISVAYGLSWGGIIRLQAWVCRRPCAWVGAIKVEAAHLRIAKTLVLTTSFSE